MYSSSSSSSSKDSLNYAENVKKDISLIECDIQKPEIRTISKSGDLSRIYEIVEWAEAVNVKGNWKTLCIVYADELFECFKQSDGAVLHALTPGADLPYKSPGARPPVRPYM